MAAGTRDKMVRSASAVLRERGVAGTSFTRVLEHSGAPRGSISHHFPGGKTELIMSAVHNAGHEITARLQHLASTGAKPEQIFIDLCDYFAAWLQQTHFTAGCPIAAVAQEAFGDEPLRNSAAKVIDEWVTVVSEGLRKDGHCSTAETREIAHVCIAGLEGAIMMSRTQQSLTPLNAVKKHLAPLLR